MNKQEIIDLLEKSDLAVARALVVLNGRQTETERQLQSTSISNGRGFSPYHARMGTSMAEFYLKTGYLSPKQLAYWRKPNKQGRPKIAMYWRQLLEAVAEKAAKTNAPGA